MDLLLHPEPYTKEELCKLFELNVSAGKSVDCKTVPFFSPNQRPRVRRLCECAAARDLFSSPARPCISHQSPRRSLVGREKSLCEISTDFGEFTFPSRRNRLKFRRDTKKGIHKNSGQFSSIYFSLFSRNSAPYFIPP